MKFPSCYFIQYGTVLQMKHEDVRCNILHAHIHLICSLRPTIPIGVGDFIRLGTAKRILEKLGIQTSSSFLAIR